jgi:hypothetical protein
LDRLFAGAINLIQYEGPDIRGRTSSHTPAGRCTSSEERQFLLLLTIASVRAADLERIPREGSLSTDPRDLPVPGVTSKKAVARDRLLRTAVLASPGILGSAKRTKPAKQEKPSNELECKPVKVVNGRDVIEVSGKSVDVYTMLGISVEKVAASNTDITPLYYILRFTTFFCFIAGLMLADYVVGFMWSAFFTSSERLAKWEPLKVWLILLIAGTASVFMDGVLGLFGVSLN